MNDSERLGTGGDRRWRLGRLAPNLAPCSSKEARKALETSDKLLEMAIFRYGQAKNQGRGLSTASTRLRCG